MNLRISKLIRIIAVATVILGIIWSCQTDENLELSSSEQFLSIEDMEGMTKLGQQLENPYSVENMKKALERLQASNPNGRTSEEEIEITTTHLYIRFKPEDEEGLAILKNDSTLTLYDYSLDYEIEETGDFYHDPAIPIDQPTYQYCAVELAKELPVGVEYELLAELFIPDEDSDEDDKENTGRRIAYSNFIDALVDQSLVLTGNLNEEDAITGDNTNARRSKWRPAGTIRVWDDNLNRFVGVEGVEVRARRWFTTHKGFANAQGRYSCDGQFRRDANYSIKWERHHYSIRSGTIGQANYNGPKRRGDWNADFRNGTQEYYATIFRAAHHYYYGDNQGLRRPPLNSFWRPQLKIAAIDKENDDKLGNHAAWRRVLGILYQIKIWNPQRDSRGIYATVIHELAHASHWHMDHGDFNDTDTKVKESWARGVQWELTRMVYPDYRGGATIRPEYTQLAVDLIDPNYPSAGANQNRGLWNDNVTGYTIRQIEDALNGRKTWNSWRDNIRNRYNNATENNLDALFTHWN